MLCDAEGFADRFTLCCWNKRVAVRKTCLLTDSATRRTHGNLWASLYLSKYWTEISPDWGKPHAELGPGSGLLLHVRVEYFFPQSSN